MPMMSRECEGSAAFGPLSSLTGIVLLQVPSCEGAEALLVDPRRPVQGFPPWSRTGAWSLGLPIMYPLIHHWC